MKFGLILLLFVTICPANDEIKRNTYFNFVSSQSMQTTHNLPHTFNLTLIVDTDSKWDLTATKEQIAKTKRTLNLCGVGISEIQFINVTLPQKTKDQLLVQNPYQGPPELKLVSEGLPKDDIVGFLHQKVRPRGTAFAVNLKSVVNSERYPTLPSFRPLLHTFWISDNHISYKNTPNADSTYSTLAHEIVHILGDLGHLENNTKKNLMGGSDQVGKSYHLISSQCQAILNYPIVR